MGTEIRGGKEMVRRKDHHQWKGEERRTEGDENFPGNVKDVV